MMNDKAYNVYSGLFGFNGGPVVAGLARQYCLVIEVENGSIQHLL